MGVQRIVNPWRKNHWIHRAIGFVCLLAGLASLPLFLAGYQKATVDADIRLNIALVIGAALLSVLGLCALLSGGIKKGFSYTSYLMNLMTAILTQASRIMPLILRMMQNKQISKLIYAWMSQLLIEILLMDIG